MDRSSACNRLLLYPLLLSVLSACSTLTTQRDPASAKADTQTGGDSLLRELAGNSGQCNVPADAGRAQYVVGYGSLMQDESRKRTAPTAGPAVPVVIKGFRRGWFAKGDAIGFETTYLGAVAQANSEMNAVMYRIDVAELQATDKRESFYCRAAIGSSAITVLNPDAQAADGQVWIYLSKPDGVATATKRHPIVQSYVDIFASGCLEQEQRHQLKNFAQQCLTTTTDWSNYWVNERIYPRRPFIHQPKARQIDKLLSEYLRQYFEAITIE